MAPRRFVTIVAGTFLLSQSVLLTASGGDVPPPAYKGYVCYQTSQPPVIDGRLDDAEWKSAAWTDSFEDIEGVAKPLPRFKTRAKMLWDDKYLYVGAELQEPNVWATMLKRDTVICLENDFEVFFDPDGDSHDYYEFEMNALNTVWDLLMKKPYRDGGPPVDSWDIKGLLTAVHVDGTLNDSRDVDRGWNLEIAFPWEALKEYARRPSPPKDGDQWRMGLYRVEWQTSATGGKYQKLPNTPPDNWAWSSHGVCDMHRPEQYGYIQFSTASPGTVAFVPDPTLQVRDALYKIYYAQKAYFKEHNQFAPTMNDLGLQMQATKRIGEPSLTAAGDRYEATSVLSLPGGKTQRWHIRQDSRIWKEE
jgi:hypothetical protein